MLCGGLGGSRLVDAFARAAGPEAVTAIVNVGDDLEFLGLHVSPDLDTVLYTLAGLLDEERGWGVRDETYSARATAEALGGETWFTLGDRDIGLHLVRTAALRAGEPLSAVTSRLAASLGVGVLLLPATDDELRTYVSTEAGELDFQTWFVRRRHADRVLGVEYRGEAAPAPGVLDAIRAADLVVFAPSNPFVSIGPILAVEGVRAALENRRVAAVSPIVGGRALRGPLADMLESFGFERSARGVADYYGDLISTFVLDPADAEPGRGGPRSGRRARGYGGARFAGGGRESGARGADVIIGIVGGSGDFGRGLGERLRLLGHEVLLGSRNPEGELVPNTLACAESELVFLSVPPAAVEETALGIAERLEGKIVVSVASPVVFRDGRPTVEAAELSLAEIAQRALPASLVVAGFHTVSARALARVDHPLDEDVILCGDDVEAKATIGELAESLVEGRAVDAGPLVVARWLEPLTVVLLHVNRRYKVSSGVRITGLDG